MLASISLEARGIPALALCTEAFTGSLTALAGVYGRPDKGWARVPHPFGSLTPDEVRARAEVFVAEFYRAVLAAG